MKYLHTMVRVRDLEASLRFYCEGLGLRETRRMENAQGRYTLVFVAADETPDAEIELTYNWPDAGGDIAPESFGGGCADNDQPYIDQAVAFLNNAHADDLQPWALIVSLVNPHDTLSFPASWDSQSTTDPTCFNYRDEAPACFQLGIELPGKVAVKVHSGEDGNQNYLHPEFMKPIIDAVNGTVVECNTAYGGARNETPKHIELMKKHHWSDLFDVDIMDAEGPDVEWPVENGKVLKVNYLGKNIENYDSMLVLIHFKGHPMGGYGGALKQLSIGCASSAGKTYIHTGGKVTDQHILWENCAEQDTFLEAMADAASTVAKHFAGKIAYVAVMKNLSVDCDCCAVAEDPCMNDVGILSSLDPVALDRACIDLVINSNDPGRDHFMERVNSRHGTHTIDTAEALGIGTQAYELVKV